jgi:predicted nucleic-acid-binding protein
VIAVDTNVLVRFLTRDDPAQSPRAVTLFGSEEIWIAKTVLLETEWVLRSLYRFKGVQVEDAFRALAGLSNVHVEDAVAVAQAFDLWNVGLDFADALHLFSRGEAETFATFDEELVKRARGAGSGRVALLKEGTQVRRPVRRVSK